MEIGVFQILCDMSADPARIAKRAEELGFAHYWIPEHPVIPIGFKSQYPGVQEGEPPPDYLYKMPDQMVALSRAAAVTSKIGLGTGITLVPERNPLLLAKEVATIDHYSGGRVLFGIGAGWNREECEVMGGDFEHRWTQTRHAILAMKALWTEEKSEYHGRYYDFPPVACFPKPTQKPHPPILLGGVTAKRVFRRIAEYGDGWLPLVESEEQVRDGIAQIAEACRERGRDPAQISVTVFGMPGQWRSRAQLESLARTGAGGVVLWIEGQREGEILAELDTLAKEVL